MPCIAFTSCTRSNKATTKQNINNLKKSNLRNENNVRVPVFEILIGLIFNGCKTVYLQMKRDIFLIFALKRRLWVLVRTASMIYVLSKIMYTPVNPSFTIYKSGV